MALSAMRTRYFLFVIPMAMSTPAVIPILAVASVIVRSCHRVIRIGLLPTT